MQLKITNDFKGKTVFIPGNHDWYNGLKGLERQQLMVTDYLGDKKSFLPRKGCGLDILDINDNLTLITIDSEWFIQNWDKHPGINDQCDIKTRDAFFEELRSLINKNQNKTILIAIHHPLLTNGPHGGYYAASKHLFPIKKSRFLS